MFSLGTPLINRSDSHTSCSPTSASSSSSRKKGFIAAPVDDGPFNDIDLTVACRMRQMHLSKKYGERAAKRSTLSSNTVFNRSV